MKKYCYGLTVNITDKTTELLTNEGFDFIIGKGYWFSSATEWDKAKQLYNKHN